MKVWMFDSTLYVGNKTSKHSMTEPLEGNFILKKSSFQKIETFQERFQKCNISYPSRLYLKHFVTSLSTNPYQTNTISFFELLSWNF